MLETIHYQIPPRWTPYRYGFNNPLIMVDPTGMSERTYSDGYGAISATAAIEVNVDNRLGDEAKPSDIIITGSDGTTFNWTPGSEYKGKDAFTSQVVLALNALTKDKSIANFSFVGRKGTGIIFEGNAILDYAKGAGKDSKNVFIQSADNNPSQPGESEHITGTIYWNPSLGITEEGFSGATGGGSFPPMGILLHEMGHAALYNEYGGADWRERRNIFANEEQMIIDRLEKIAMQSLGFGYRTSHNTAKDREEVLRSNQGRLRTNLPFIASYYFLSSSPVNLR